jgi:hypothetical protein
MQKAGFPAMPAWLAELTGLLQALPDLPGTFWGFSFVVGYQITLTQPT